MLLQAAGGAMAVLGILFCSRGWDREGQQLGICSAAEVAVPAQVGRPCQGQAVTVARLLLRVAV